MYFLSPIKMKLCILINFNDFKDIGPKPQQIEYTSGVQMPHVGPLFRTYILPFTLLCLVVTNLGEP